MIQQESVRLQNGSNLSNFKLVFLKMSFFSDARHDISRRKYRDIKNF